MPETRQASRQPRPAPELPDRVTMPLLTLITQQSFDEDYAHVAERRAEAAPEGDRQGPARNGRTGGSHRMAAAVVAVFGVLVTTAAVQQSREAGVDTQSRETLVSQISDRQETVSRLQSRSVSLRSRNVGLADRLARVSRTAEAATARMRALETTTGFGPVTGPGVRIVLDDAPNGDTTQLVRDEDLAKLVDGLWNAGAEAISVNGQRLTALSAIRNVGITIHVNSHPVSPPYVVKAVGDEKTLQARLLETTHGQEFYSLVDQLGFRFTMDDVDALSLPAANLRTLRSATEKSMRPPRATRLTEETTP